MDTSLGLLLIVMIMFKFSPSSAQTGICDPVTNNCVNGVCQLQTNNNYGCVCLQNYIRSPTNPLVCNVMSPCDPNNVQQCINGVCQIQVDGQYHCSCNAGFQIDPNDATRCVDTNECIVPGTPCAPGACIDMVGDFQCSACIVGYNLNQMGKCEPINQIIPNQPGGFPTVFNGGFPPGFSSFFPSNFAGNNPFLWAMMMDEFF